jgi:hypothetical protein
VSWYKAILSNEALKLGTLRRLVSAYSELRLRVGSPRHTAIFSRHTTKGTDVYFSPEASRIAPGLLREYGATPCEKPKGASLLVGDQADVHDDR